MCVLWLCSDSHRNVWKPSVDEISEEKAYQDEKTAQQPTRQSARKREREEAGDTERKAGADQVKQCSAGEQLLASLQALQSKLPVCGSVCDPLLHVSVRCMTVIGDVLHIVMNVYIIVIML